MGLEENIENEVEQSEVVQITSKISSSSTQKILQQLASSAKQPMDTAVSEKLNGSDTKSIIAGKMGSDVSTPAKTKPSIKQYFSPVGHKKSGSGVGMASVSIKNEEF